MRSVLSAAARTLLAAAAYAGLAAAAYAHEVKKGDLVVEHPLARASLGRVPNTAGYFIVRNTGRTPDRLVGASCACAARVELHGSVVRNGVASMQRVTAVAIPAGGAVVFAPTANHLMIMGLRKPLEAGTMVPITLRFERAGAVQVPFFVTARVEQELAAHRGEHHH